LVSSIVEVLDKVLICMKAHMITNSG